MLKKFPLFWLLGTLAALFFVIAMLGSSSFQECTHRCAHAAKEQQSVSSSFFSVINFVLYWTRLNCVSLFITSAHDELLAGFTILLAIVTLALWGSTAQLAEDAKATGARTITTMEDTAKRQLRAYVFPIHSGLSNLVVGGVPAFHVTIKNSGQTPAYRVKHRAAGWITTYPIEGAFPEIPPPGEQMVSTNNLGPGGDQVKNGNCSDVPLTAGTMSDLEKGKSAIYVYGEINFRDAFGKDRWVNYRHMTGGSVGFRRDGFIVHCEDGNETSEDEETGLSPRP